MNKPSLLIIDDEKEVLSALERLLRKDFRLFLFTDPLKALHFYKENPIPLVLSDMRMPEMDGATLLGEIAQIYPKSQRLILTGHADLASTVAAVNQGHISHYFNKPWDNHELINTLKSAFVDYQKQLLPIKLLKQNRHENLRLSQQNDSLLKVVQDKQSKLDASLSHLQQNENNFIELYANLISLHTQDHTGHNLRIASQARCITRQLGYDHKTTHQAHLVALLYETGKLAIPQTLLTCCYDSLNKHQQTNYNQFYPLAEAIMQPVDNLKPIAKIIKHIPNHYDGLGAPDHLQGEAIPFISRLIAILSAFDNLLLGRKMPLSCSFVKAKKLIEAQVDKHYDPHLIACFSTLMKNLTHSKDDAVEYLINAAQLRIGMQLSQDIHNTHQAILLTKGTLITQLHIDKLLHLENTQQEVLLIYVHTMAD
ncbi:HD domain-containing phosphohydrolase [Psychromonas hadalis]|uniref:HD domain-containing phosphohydrolase n=1 Tax=Psychromonas hadalis TaxID=211669 RepID=UPI0003B74B11|nr:HD domain-containing phosphohydrolase [Psychromonas hadalis]